MIFFMFSKDKSSELQYHLEQDKQQLRPFHIIYVNYLDLDPVCATHEFQVQSKSLYQNNLIQNSGEFKAKNQVLERNYNRATIHHFHLRDYSKSSLFYSTLKNKIKQTRHTFLFCFQFYHFLKYLKETKTRTKGKHTYLNTHECFTPKLALSVRVWCFKSFELDFL